MKHVPENASTGSEGPQRRLSPWRVLFAIVLVAGMSSGMFFGWQQWQKAKSTPLYMPWFAAYVDVTATPLYTFEQLGTTATHNVVLSFIVSSSTDACTPSWGNAYTLAEANGGLDLDRRIARLRQLGGNVAVSFGGQRNHELAVDCKNPGQLITAYQSVIQRYALDTVDLDLEGNGLADAAAGKRRAVALALLQKTYRSEKKSLAVWLTLPVTPQGLTEEGTNAVAQMLASGVDVAGVNVMTMDYAESRDAHESMQQASARALIATHRQLGILYTQSGRSLSSASLWEKIGATPMIGQNDVLTDIFTVDDAVLLNKFASSQGVGRLSMWSGNRDIQCGDNYVDTKIVSDSCSGVKQERLRFAASLGNGFGGDISHNASVVTTEDHSSTTQEADDPKKSPYQIWKTTGAYLKGTKVVWHRNVYLAKWWTQGDMPDNPVLQEWQTSWQLIGPVLHGEKPIPQPTLPVGTYPEWSGTVEYDANQRVLFHGVPYQTKWWNKGDSPAIATANPDNSPWVPLTQEQVNEVAREKKAGTLNPSETPVPANIGPLTGEQVQPTTPVPSNAPTEQPTPTVFVNPATGT